jgi:5'-3' exonuclease
MILIDMNQIMISNLMMQLKYDTLNENLVRHMVLTGLRSYEKQFSLQYGDLVLAYDSKHYWRKEVFPYYKQNRKKDREASELDWNAIFEVLNKIRDEIKVYFPYKVVEVYGAEADDVICTLCKHQAKVNIQLQKEGQQKEKILILSGDKDFIQLQKYPFVKQFNPILKKEIKHDDPKSYVLEHVIKGDKSDGIPNFLSDDDTFVTNKRQKPISKKNLERWVSLDPWDFCSTPEAKANYLRNRKLIDFECVPADIENKIIDQYESLNTDEKQVPLEYFQKHQLNDLMQEFYFRRNKLTFNNK